MNFQALINQKRAEKAQLVEASDAMRTVAKDDGRDPTDDELAKIDANLDQAEAIDKEIADLEARQKREQRLDAAKADLDKGVGRRTTEPAVTSQTGAVTDMKLSVEDDPRKGFQTPRDFIKAVLDHGQGVSDSRIKNIDGLRVLKAAAGGDEQGTHSDPYGGFLVPIAFSPNVLKVDPEADPMGASVQRLPMEAPTVKIPARTDKTHTSSVSGGLTVSRRAETAAASASRMQVEQIELNAQSLFGLAYATEELLQDSPSTFAAMLAMGFQEEFTSKIIDERLNGDGAAEFLGVINSPGLVTVAKETSQTADTINGTNILKMRARCWGYERAIWLANHDTYTNLIACHSAATNTDALLFNPARGIDAPDTLLGRPIIFTEYCKTIGDLGDIVLGNWSQYIEGVYQGLASGESIHVRFVNHERTFKFWLRNAGAPWWRSALTPKNSSSTLSPFVALAARA